LAGQSRQSTGVICDISQGPAAPSDFKVQ